MSKPAGHERLLDNSRKSGGHGKITINESRVARSSKTLQVSKAMGRKALKAIARHQLIAGVVMLWAVGDDLNEARKRHEETAAP
jgi:hypothetical protein